MTNDRRLWEKYPEVGPMSRFGESKYPHYYGIYDKHFARLYGTRCTVLEIGIANGGSLKLWRHLFGTNATIAGLDYSPNAAWEKLTAGGFRLFPGRQEDLEVLATVQQALGTIDVVIDDGGHQDADIRASFDFLYPRMSEYGVYLIEDIHSPNDYPFATWARERVHDLGASMQSENQSTFGKTTQSIHFYNSVIVFERGDATRKDGE